MADGVLLIQTEPRAGREAEYERFYDGVHVPEILQTPGFERARRFRAVRSSELPERPDGEWHSNLVIYDVIADDLAGAYAGLIDRMHSGQLTRRDVFSDERPYRAMLFERTFEAQGATTA